MNLPSDTPRLPKWIFLVGDLALLTTAWVIFDQSGRPFAGVPLISFAACVIAAGVIGVIPFVSDYARKQDEALDERQRSLQALSVTVAAASEQISIAATGLQGIAEAAQDSLAKSQAAAKDIAAKMLEFQAVLAASRKDGADSAARLEAAAKAIAASNAGSEAAATKALQAAQEGQSKVDALSKQVLEKLSELRTLQASGSKEGREAALQLESVAKRLSEAVVALENASAKPVLLPVVHTPEVPPVPPSRIVEIKPAAAPSYSPFDAGTSTDSPEPTPAPAPEASPVAEAPLLAEAPAPRKRSPRKPAAPPPDEPASEAAAPESVSQAPASEASESAVSADGATRLVVTAYIGIGNRLFIRGEGPGLSWDKGIPLSFVSIGKWRWETNDATSAVKFRIYKNDETECTGLGERSVEPGAQLDLTASF
jgi:uncharacterized protein YoxC